MARDGDLCHSLDFLWLLGFGNDAVLSALKLLLSSIPRIFFDLES
jgi:hypothetical protein